jgi:predicted nucleic acid-binding protein
MKNTVLIDTNIIVDYLIRREPYIAEAEKIFTLVSDRRFEGYIAAHSFKNIFYILRHVFPAKQRRKLLLGLGMLFGVVEVNEEKILATIHKEDFADFEDCLQAECAKSISAEYIVTRNAKDYAGTEVAAITPEAFLQYFEQAGFADSE